MNDVPTWAKVLLSLAGAVAVAVLLYVVVYAAVRQALRKGEAERRKSAERSEELLTAISAATEYIADVADAWAQAEADRRGAPRVADRAPAAPGPVASAATPSDGERAGTGSRDE